MDKLVVDCREHKILKLLPKCDNICTARLDVGDYIIRKKVYERKTLADMSASICDKRLDRQIKNMQGMDFYFIIEGQPEKYHAMSKYRKNHLQPISIIHSKLRSMMDNGIKLIFTTSQEETIKYLLTECGYFSGTIASNSSAASSSCSS